MVDTLNVEDKFLSTLRLAITPGKLENDFSLLLILPFIQTNNNPWEAVRTAHTYQFTILLKSRILSI